MTVPSSSASIVPAKQLEEEKKDFSEQTWANMRDRANAKFVRVNPNPSTVEGDKSSFFAFVELQVTENKRYHGSLDA
jgi:hypothetical protein